MEDKKEMRAKLVMVVVLLCGAFLVMLNITLLNPALPTIMEDFGIGATTVQWLTSAYTLVEAVVIPLSAYLLGRFGTRRLFLFGIGIFTALSLVAAVAPSFPVLLVARALQAVGSGIVMPMTVTLIMLIFPREKRGTAMGLVTLVIGFAPTIGPTLGGLLVDSIGWRALFGIITVLGLLVFVIGTKFITNFEGFESYSLDVPSVLLMVVGMISLLYGISSSTSAANVALPLVLIVVGVVVLGLFVKRQLELEQPMLKLSTLQSRKFRLNIIVVMLVQGAMVGGTVLMPLYVQDVLGYSATVSGLIALPGALVGAILGMLSGRVFDRYGVRGITVSAITIMAVATICIANWGIASPLAFVVVSYACFTCFSQVVITPMNTWGINSLDNKVVQHANSLSNSLNQVAGSVGTALLTSLTALGALAAPNGTALQQTYLGDHFAFVGLCVLVLICAFVVYVFVREKKEQPATEAAPAAVAATTAPATATAGAAAAAATPANGESWLVCEAMDHSPKYVRADDKVGAAFDIFASTETDGVPIIDEADHVVGYLSDGDVLDYLGQKDFSYTGLAANMYRVVDDEHIQDSMLKLFELDVMTLATKKVITLDEDTTLEKACGIFAERKLKKAPVVRDGKLVGSLSRRNIMSFVATKAHRGAIAEAEAAAEGTPAAAAGAAAQA